MSFNLPEQWEIEMMEDEWCGLEVKPVSKEPRPPRRSLWQWIKGVAPS